ncbi:conserved hypothetical protein [Thermosinus carboxydivorans Nor1]|uniref:NAD-specific glutamate dehydrogenase n=1 Tax=Thermosinus carboxydivorans Nor1 TaxID=401526 RepID=A1HQK7_9FIRM|nr:conserved hypothetical protein [Thermosinus carboxydivorans Nor1]
MNTGTGFHTFDAAPARVEIADNVAHIFFRHGNFDLHVRLEEHRVGFLCASLEAHRTSNLEGHFRRVYIMVRTIIDGNFDVHHRITGQHTVFHCFFDAALDCWDIFFRNNTTDNLVFEDKTFARLKGLDFQPAVAILTAATGLTDELAFRLDCLADGFTVSNLGFANVAIDLELAQHAVDDDFQVQLAHTLDNGLTGFLVSIHPESRVFFRQPLESDGHFLLVSLGFRFNGYRNNRLGEDHRLENDGVFLIAQRIAGRGIFKTDGSGDVTGANFVNFFAVIGMHLEDAANPLFFALSRVVYIRTGRQLTGINAEESKLAHIGVGHNFEGQRRKGQVIFCLTVVFRTSIGINPANSRDISRRRQVVDNGVEQRLYTLIAVRRTAQHRRHLARNRRFADTGFNFLDGELFPFQVFHHQLIIALGHGIQQVLPVQFSLLAHVFRNIGSLTGLAEVIGVNDGLHFNQVNNTFEGILKTNGQLDRHRIGAQPGFHHFYNPIKIGADYVHFVYIGNTRNTIFIRLAPYRFGLGLNTTLGAKYRNRTIKHSERALYLNREVHVPWCVNNVDPVTLPLTSSGRRGNGNTSLLLLDHPVHRRSAIMDFTNFVHSACIEEDAFSCRGLTGVNVCHDANVPRLFERKLSGHYHHSLQYIRNYHR